MNFLKTTQNRQFLIIQYIWLRSELIQWKLWIYEWLLSLADPLALHFYFMHCHPQFEWLFLLNFSNVTIFRYSQCVLFGITTVIPSPFEVYWLSLYIDCKFTTHRVHGISDVIRMDKLVHIQLSDEWRMGSNPTTINVYFRYKSSHSRWYFDDEYLN